MKKKRVVVPTGLQKRVMQFLVNMQRLGAEDRFSDVLLAQVPMSMIQRVPFIKSTEISLLVEFLESKGLEFIGGPNKETCENFAIKHAILLLTKNGYSVVKK